MDGSEVEIDAGDAGQRLDRVLAAKLELSRARVRHLLDVGRISRSGRPLGLSDKSHSVSAGERYGVSGVLRAEQERPIPRPDLPDPIVESGPGWLVADKPAGWPVHPLRPEEDDTVLNSVLARLPEIEGVGEGGLRSGVVHRLDVETSGALVMATDAEAWQRLRGAFADHRVSKFYWALVEGRFERARRVDFPLEITQHQPARVRVKKGGKPCRAFAKPLRVFEHATLVEVRLETGFLHQIRASMAHLGHPVLGDAVYKAKEENAGDAELGVASDLAPEVRVGGNYARHMLHAHRVAVDEIAVEVPVPADFEEALDALERTQGG